ncbi:hypothetical protein KR759_12730 [Staphylococcus aureus]|uniref:hypothetical protein n=1 Tax=Staphylococcus aureus TaxID=1280 RepID=UPI001C1FBF3D|nr:hypothetical protein [Staphylococcus aureus]MBU7062226.1 hypothetical protein [Staphylococcus aureus]
MLSIISMCHKFHFTDNIKIIKFILLCILQIKHCIIEITIFCYFQFSTIYIYYTEGVRRINRVIFVYIALIITLVRSIILCVIGFKAEKLIATMVIIPNFLGILYRLYAYVTHILFM